MSRTPREKRQRRRISKLRCIRIEMGLRRKRGLFKSPPAYDQSTWNVLYRRKPIVDRIAEQAAIFLAQRAAIEDKRGQKRLHKLHRATERTKQRKLWQSMHQRMDG